MAGELHNPAVFGYSASNRLITPITFGPTTASGTSTASGATSLTDTNSSFTVDAFIGLTVYSNGSSGVVTTNSATVITVGSWTGGTPTAVKPYQVAAAGINGPIGTVTLGTISSSGIVMVRSILIVGVTTLTAVGNTARGIVGVTGSTSAFYATSSADYTGLTAGKFQADGAVPTTGALLETTRRNNVAINANIILTISGENILTGAISAITYWDPISNGATLS